MSTPVIAVEISKNDKIGRASATMQSQATCPSTCVFRDNGCYAETGLQAMHTRRLNASTIVDVDVIADMHADAIRGLSGRRPLRIDVVGDCRTDYAASVVSEAARAYSAHHGQPTWTYTHAWRDVVRESWGDVSVLASCETADDLTRAKAAGYATAVVYDNGSAAPSVKAFAMGDHKVIPCPEQASKKGLTCTDCRLCIDAPKLQSRDITIGFHAHGSGAGKARKAIGMRNAESEDAS